MTDSGKYRNGVCTFAVLAMFVYMLVRSSETTAAAEKAAVFCASVIVPSLFVNMALAAYLFPRIANAMHGKHTAVTAFFCGILCGFPVGADIAVRLREGGADGNYCDYINSFSNNASVSFVLSFAGIGALKSVSAGIVLVLLEIVSAGICAFAMRMLLSPECKVPIPIQRELSFTEALRKAISGMASVCASIIVFSCLSSAATLVFNEGSAMYALLHGILEFSGGIADASVLPERMAFVATAFFVGWSGLCVALQVAAVGRGRANMSYYIISKALQGVLMAGMAAATARFVP